MARALPIKEGSTRQPAQDGSWVFPGKPSATNAQIDMVISQLVAAVNKYGGFLHIDLVIGNEVNRADVVVCSPADILGGMAYAKQAVICDLLLATSLLRVRRRKTSRRKDWSFSIHRPDKL
jgi:hypothetical protein